MEHAKKDPAKLGMTLSCQAYWNSRYIQKGTSGSGSYGKLAEFKAKIINEFIKRKNIEGLIDLGCGDGNQATHFKVNRYIGVDIADAAIDICRNKFKDDNAKLFLPLNRFREQIKKEQLSISLDVIFHLIEDDLYEDYMRLLFESSNRFCIIYSSDQINLHTRAPHVKGRNFTKWIDQNEPEWQLISYIPNEYPYFEVLNASESSFSDFYIYERQ